VQVQLAASQTDRVVCTAAAVKWRKTGSAVTCSQAAGKQVSDGFVIFVEH
jgi:hypothetical protein